jgi:hypothetical protein
VYKPIVTLKEAQEEEAREMSRWRVENYLETKPFIPLKDTTQSDIVSKVPPLEHLWHQAKVLPKTPKGFNYAKL